MSYQLTPEERGRILADAPNIVATALIKFPNLISKPLATAPQKLTRSDIIEILNEMEVGETVTFQASECVNIRTAIHFANMEATDSSWHSVRRLDGSIAVMRKIIQTQRQTS